MSEHSPIFGEESLGILFQGQNVNNQDMGRLLNKFSSAKNIFDLADDVLDFDVREVCFGSLTHLQDDPRFVQPAIVTTELAEYRAWQDFNDGLKPDLVTGLSLGMYAALAAVGSAEDSAVIDISAKRGKLVAQNAKWRPGGMVKIKGLPEQSNLDELISNTKTAIAIWWGSHGLVTLSGAKSHIRKAEMIANSINGVSAEISKVKEGAHHAIQKRTQKPLIKVLQAAGLVNPEIAFLSNDPLKHQTGFLKDADEIISHLADQMIDPVDMDSVTTQIVLSGISRILEIGPDREFGLTSQVIRKSRQGEIRDIRERMGRSAIKRLKFDYDELLAA